MNIAGILKAFLRLALRPPETAAPEGYPARPESARGETAAEGDNRGPVGEQQLLPLDLPFPGRFYLWRPACGERDPHPDPGGGVYLVWVIHTARLGALRVAAFATEQHLHTTFFTAGEEAAGVLRAGLPQLRPELLRLGFHRVLLDVRYHPDPPEGPGEEAGRYRYV